MSADERVLTFGRAGGVRSPRGPGDGRARRLFASEEEPLGAWPRRWGGRALELVRTRGGPQLLPLVAGLAVGVLSSSWLPLLIGAACVPLAARWLRRRLLVRGAEEREEEVIELCSVVAGELRAGRPPAQALSVGTELVGHGEEGGFLEGTAVPAAARFGGDVPEALREAARTEGAQGLSGVVACWQVAVDGGAGLARALERVGSSLQAEREQREELRAQLAGPWATVAVLAMLPVLGLVLGSAMEAEPLQVLFHTPSGLVCLLLGGLFEGAGLWWTCAIVRAAERG
ncbi:type II secretion system F family protein [Streptomyces sulphureus]|uniref:type II secretion system F family protein n=1 Tax=Streptomyces sulphureus TaxID=47758 RepID=UPI000399BA86|nr:type II secretion system F family protein [Streptomyces sulphureus]